MDRVLRILIAAFLLASAGCLSVSYLPYAPARKLVDRVAPGKGGRFTQERCNSLRGHFRLPAAICLFTAAVLSGYRRRILAQYRRTLAEGSRFWADCRREVSSWFQDPWVLWPLLAVFLIGLIMRLLELSRPVRYDEIFSYTIYAKRPLWRALSDYSTPNNHLFHTLLMYLSTRLFGDAPEALRLPALAGGLLMLPATFAAAAALYNRAAAVAATALVACSAPFIEYSVNGRGYTWQALFLLLMAWFACRIGRQEDAPLDWLGLVVAAVGAIYTCPASALPCAAILFWLVLTRWQWGGWRGARRAVGEMTPVALSILALVLLLYIPPLIFSGPELVLENKYVQPLGAAGFLAQAPAFARITWLRWTDGLPLAARGALCAVFLAGLLAHRRISRHAVPLTLWIILLGAAFAVARTVLGYSRVWLYLWAFFLITAGAGVAWILSRRYLVAVFAVVFAAVAGAAAHRQEIYYWSTETGNIPGLAAAAEWLDRNLDSRDGVVASPMCAFPLAYLAHRHWPRLEPRIDKPVPAPRRIVAVIAKQYDVRAEEAGDRNRWRVPEADPAAILFAQHDPARYSPPRIAKDLTGVTIWEAWSVSAAAPDRR